MTNEIKEILDDPKILMLSYGNYISLEDYVKLKDYITNLQQRIDKAVEYIEKEFTNEDGTCWHEEMKYILDILRGDE